MTWICNKQNKLRMIPHQLRIKSLLNLILERKRELKVLGLNRNRAWKWTIISIKKKLKGRAPARCTLRAARPLLQSPHATSAMCTHAAVAEADLGWERYKFVVQTVVGEQRGEGIK